MRKIIPNAVTALNIVFGTLSIIMTMQHNYPMAAIMILVAFIADALDGRVARALNVSSEFGKELDSLCDLVSFGVAPGLLAWQGVLKGQDSVIAIVIAILFALCGALRLARFNINTTVIKGYFLGMPIPTAGCIIATYVLSGLTMPENWFLVFAAITALLMVSTVHYPDFKSSGDPMRILAIIVTVIFVVGILYLRWQAWIFLPFGAFGLFGILNSACNSINPVK